MDNTPAKDLNDLLITRGFEPEALDGKTGKPPVGESGQIDVSQADMFSFDYKTENQNYGTVVLLLSPDNALEVYFGDNLGRTMEGDDKREWYQFLEQLKNFSTRNRMEFKLENLSRLKYTMQGIAAIKEGLFEGYYGKKNVSYSDSPKKVRLMIKHNRELGEDEARYRAIESLFIETPDGERFKLPFKNLLGGKVMATHVSAGGNPYDAFGQHITEMISEMSTLAKFIRASRNRKFSGDTDELVNAAVRHYSDLKAKAKRMIGNRGYTIEKESYDPLAVPGHAETTESIRNMFIEQNIDHRIEEALPILARLAEINKETKMKEANEFESWANNVAQGVAEGAFDDASPMAKDSIKQDKIRSLKNLIAIAKEKGRQLRVQELELELKKLQGVAEGTWALPDNPEYMSKLKELMSKPLVVGADGTNATEQLYDLIGDDHLFDIIGDLAARDPNANLWDSEEAMSRIEELVPELSNDAVDESAPQKMNIPAYLRKQRGDEPLKLSDLKRKDTISDLENLRRLAGYDTKQVNNEDLDTDGVMMTKQSNMSS